MSKGFLVRFLDAFHNRNGSMYGRESIEERDPRMRTSPSSTCPRPAAHFTGAYSLRSALTSYAIYYAFLRTPCQLVRGHRSLRTIRGLEGRPRVRFGRSFLERYKAAVGFLELARESAKGNLTWPHIKEGETKEGMKERRGHKGG